MSEVNKNLSMRAARIAFLMLSTHPRYRIDGGAPMFLGNWEGNPNDEFLGEGLADFVSYLLTGDGGMWGPMSPGIATLADATETLGNLAQFLVDESGLPDDQKGIQMDAHDAWAMEVLPPIYE